jgi:hypothetical protein
MKRIKISPGKWVSVSDELVAKAERALADFGLTREEAERIAAAEPRGATIFAGKLTPLRKSLNRDPRPR